MLLHLKTFSQDSEICLNKYFSHFREKANQQNYESSLNRAVFFMLCMEMLHQKD